MRCLTAAPNSQAPHLSWADLLSYRHSVPDLTPAPHVFVLGRTSWVTGKHKSVPTKGAFGNLRSVMCLSWALMTFGRQPYSSPLGRTFGRQPYSSPLERTSWVSALRAHRRCLTRAPRWLKTFGRQPPVGWSCLTFGRWATNLEGPPTDRRSAHAQFKHMTELMHRRSAKLKCGACELGA
jgi:hypothetical protein